MKYIESIRKQEEALKSVLKRYDTGFFNPYAYLESFKKHQGFTYILNLKHSEKNRSFIKEATSAIKKEFLKLYELQISALVYGGERYE